MTDSIPDSAATGNISTAQTVALHRSDHLCRCGHGHDASHDPDGTCLRPGCGCVNDGQTTDGT